MYGKLAKAVEVLITNHGDVRNRVWVASKYLFMMTPEGVPARCKDDVVWIHHMLTRYPAFGYHKTALDATYQRTRCVTASKIAARVWRLFHEYQTAFEAQAVADRRRLTPQSRGKRARAARAPHRERSAS